MFKRAWFMFWGWVAMQGIQRIGYKGWAPIEVEGQWFLVLIPNDVELPPVSVGFEEFQHSHGEGDECCNMGENNNEAC